MIYADSDFFLALLKKKDWLKKKALRQHTKHRGKIFTSVTTIIEIAIICRRKNLAVDTVLGAIFKLADVRGITIQEAMEAAELMNEYGVTPFDSFHAVFAGEHPLLSSDSIYDKIGKERVRLEE